MLRTVPLFPLGTVLFPGLVLPLHIFEPRYRTLVADLLAGRIVTGGDQEDRAAGEGGGERAFGVVAIRAGREVGHDGVRALHAVGCLARLTDVTALPDGRYDIESVGTRRFRLREIVAGTGTSDGVVPYLAARVEELDEPDGVDAAAMVPGVVTRFDRYRRRLRASGGTTPTEPRLLSYTVAATMLLDLTDRQRLLEAEDTSARLRRERHLLRREEVLLSTLSAVPATDVIRREPVAN